MKNGQRTSTMNIDALYEEMEINELK